MEKHIALRLNNHVITLVFCLAIFIPFFTSLFQTDKKISITEQRTLHKKPELPMTMEQIKSFPALFNDYYSDHFGFRDRFNKHYKFLKYTIGDSPSDDVTIGKNGWLFLGSIKKGYSGYSDPMGDARNVNLFSQTELEQFTTRINSLDHWMAAKGLKYIFVLAPNKHTVYFEQLPDYISKVNKYSAADQLINHLKKHSRVPVIDLRQKLINARQKHPLYYKTDTHWNSYAANIAQYEIMVEVEKLFPGKITPELQDIEESVLKGGDLARFIGIDFFELYPEPVFKDSCKPRKLPPDGSDKTVVTFICDTQKLKTIIFGDSFSYALRPYFSRKFNRCTFIEKKLNYSSLKKQMALEKPDIIIEEWVERELPCLPEIFTRGKFKTMD